MLDDYDYNVGTKEAEICLIEFNESNVTETQEQLADYAEQMARETEDIISNWEKKLDNLLADVNSLSVPEVEKFDIFEKRIDELDFPETDYADLITDSVIVAEISGILQETPN